MFADRIYDMLVHLVRLLAGVRQGGVLSQFFGGFYTGWTKKVSHYRESSLNRIKNRQSG